MGIRSIKRQMIEPEARSTVEPLRRGAAAPFKGIEKRRAYVDALRVARRKALER